MMKLRTKIHFWSFAFVLVFLLGCSRQPSHIVLSHTPGVTTVSQTRSKTPTPNVKILNTTTSPATPTVYSTPVPYATSTQVPPYQQVSVLGKGTYLVIIGGNEYHDFSYILLSTSGKVVKGFRLDYIVESISGDFRFLTYPRDFGPISRALYWASSDAPGDLQQLAENCIQPAWSKDNEKIALLCRDGIRIMAFNGNNWVESVKIGRPKEIHYLPEDVYLFNFPGWMPNGFAFSVDYSSLAKNEDTPYNFYFLSNDCLKNESQCELDTPGLTIDNGPISAVAISPEEPFLAVSAIDKEQIQIFNVETKKMIKAIHFSSIDPKENFRFFNSMIWGQQKGQLLIESSESPIIYQLPSIDAKNFEPFFDCSTLHINGCTILGWINIK